MKLTEIIISMAIFLICAIVFLNTLVNVTKSVTKSTAKTNQVSSIISIDYAIRKDIRTIEIPYWKNISSYYSTIENHLLLLEAEKGITITSVSPVYNKKHKREGIQVIWTTNNKQYITTEYIKQRILDEE